MTTIVLDDTVEEQQKQLKQSLINIINNEKTFLKSVNYDWLDGPTDSITFEYFTADNITKSEG